MTSATNNATEPDDGETLDRSAEQGASTGAATLVVVYCPNEPWRVGEAALLPARGRGEFVVLGRGTGQADDPWPRLAFARYAGGRVESAPALGVAALSRRQALIRTGDDGVIEIENIGKSALFHNEVETEKAHVAVNDVIRFGKRFALLCVDRRRLPAIGDNYPPHVYGEADAFGLVGESAVAASLRASIAFLATRPEHVLIFGPSGTGKELIARALHELSARGARSMVSRNAATIPEGLIDAELFGNLKNYPHAGMAARPGLVGEAHESTLFLDEFAELPSALQAHLLRVLDCGEYQRLGDANLVRSDFRLIAATNRPLHMIKEDLLARFKLRIEVSDLNARREDIPWLVRHLLRRFAATDGKLPKLLFSNGDATGEPNVGVDFWVRLLRHGYRTNVRELEMILWASIQEAESGVLRWPARIGRSEAPDPADSDDANPPLAATREHLQAVLDRHNGRIESAWRELGLRNRYVLRRLIAKHRIELRRRPG